MNILMLSVDGKIFEKGSDVRDRMISYSSLFDELHIVIHTPRGFIEEKIAPNVFIYPTNSLIKFLYFWDGYGICEKLLKQHLDFILTSQDAMTNILALQLKMQFSFPLQVQIHTDFLSPYFRKESFKNFIRYLIYKISLRYADCVRVVSNRIKNSIYETSDVQQDIRCPAITLPIYTDVQKIKNAQPKTLPKQYDFTLLWVGRLEREKNCSLAVSAFAQFAKKFPNAGLIIVGDGSERKKLELYAKRYTLNAHFVGWKNDVAGYYKSADVLLVTSWYEGYGMNMVEARIAGTPVVATDVGVACEVGAYITNYTEESIVNMLTLLYNNALPKPPEYRYPYENKERYLELYKKSFEQCLLNDRRI